jgi:hypothetical protein
VVAHGLHKTEIQSTDFIWAYATTVFAHSNTEIMDSNPTQGMDVCVYSVFVLGSGLRRADHSSKESYRLSKTTKRFTDALCSRRSNSNKIEQIKQVYATVE